MENQIKDQILDQTGPGAHALSQSFISRVLTYMAGGLVVSGILAYVFGTSPELMQYIVNFETGGMTGLGWVALLAPFGLVLLMGTRLTKMSAQTMMLMFVLFSALMGISLSTIFLIYPIGTIYTTFGVTAITFVVMAIIGYTTKTDLTKFGSILMLGLIGIIVAMVVNMFMQSAMMDYLISVIGVLIFTGLIAYDMQKLKRIGMGVEYGTQAESKLAMMGALGLYLNFVNLFLFLLRIFGGNRS
jgi:FtsH-binding integral membrane protein